MVTEIKKTPSKRVQVVEVQLVKERSFQFSERRIGKPEDAVQVFKQYLGGEKDREHFVIIGVSSKNEPIIIQTVHIGAIASSIVSPREVMKALILSNCAAFIALHNHPSGDPSPSPEDIQVTHRLKDAGELIGIKLLDHIIVGEYEISLAQRGELQ